MGRSRSPRRFGLAALGLTVLAALGAPPSAAAGETVFMAQFVCNDRGAVYPLAGARVEFWKRGVDELPKWLTDSLLTVRHTDADGRVAVKVSGPEDDFYFRIQLSSDGVRAEDWWAPWAWFADTATNQNDVPVQDYGGQGLGDGRIPPECAAFEGARRAYQGYRSEIGARPPYGTLVVKTNSPSGGVPFAPHTRVQWPPRYPPGREPGGFETSSHEFAHTVRHAFDGSLAHFFLDVGRFSYLQQHSACKRTNEGFAFNEGWAAYWAGDYAPAPNCPGIPATDYRVEGNVAAALRGLERFCPRVDRRRMVDVLRRNPLGIHSFEEFRIALGCPYPELPVAALHTPQDPLTRQARLAYGKHQVTAIGKTIRSLTSELRAAQRIARLPGPCPPRPCDRALARAILPPLLRAELAQARSLRKTLSVQASTRGLKRLGAPESRRFHRRLDAGARRFRRRSATAGKRGVVRALRAARPILRKDRSAAVTALNRSLQAALRSFRNGRLPAGFAVTTPGAPSLVTGAVLPAAMSPLPPPPPPDEPLPSPEPDLIVDRVYAVAGGANFEVRVDVRNQGVGNAPATKTAITPEGHPEALVDTPPLAPGDSVTVSTPCPYTTPSASARADATDVAKESDETNNAGAAAPTGLFCRYP